MTTTQKQENTTLNLDLVLPPEIDIRSKFSHSDIEELAASMNTVGLIEPIIVRKRDDFYEVVAGHRRYLSAKHLNWLTIPVIIRDLNDRETLTLRIHENLHREDMTPLDESNFVAVLHLEYKMSLNEVSDTLKKSKNWIKDRLDIFYLPDNFKQALQDQAVKPQVALLLVQITNEPYRDELLKRACFSGLTRAQAQLWLNDWKGFPINDSDATQIPQEFHDNNTPVGEHLQCKICDSDVKLGNYAMLLICPSCHMQILDSKAGSETPAHDCQSQDTPTT